MFSCKKLVSSISVALLLTSGTLFADMAGVAQGGKVSAYLKGALTDAEALKSKLSSAGFEILGESNNGGGTTIAFTCPTLKKLGSKPHKGFAAVMRAFVNSNDGEISITNPLYFEKGYLGRGYDEVAAKKILSKLNSAIGGLKNSTDKLKNSKLSHYHFMIGMPYYEDMDTVAKGDHNTLLSKIKATGKVAYELTLSPNVTVLGYNLDNNSFVNTIGTKDGILLPYPVLIEGNKAKILAPKYYIALSYPLLKMGQFMKISTVPGKIEDEIEAAFK